MITAPQHAVADSAYDAIRAAVIHMIRAGEIRSDSSAGPVYFVLPTRQTRAGPANSQPPGTETWRRSPARCLPHPDQPPSGLRDHLVAAFELTLAGPRLDPSLSGRRRHRIVPGHLLWCPDPVGRR